MTESKEIRVMRCIAWERAKGELRAVLQTYWSEGEESYFNQMDQAVNSFIDKVESNGWAE